MTKNFTTKCLEFNFRLCCCRCSLIVFVDVIVVYGVVEYGSETTKLHEAAHSQALSFQSKDSRRSCLMLVIISKHRSQFLLRPYQEESTTSRPISEVKPLRARLVLGLETTWELRVP